MNRPVVLRSVCAYYTHMQDELTDLYRKALELAVPTVRDLADALERSERTLHAYKAGERRVTLEAARELARLLQGRSEQLTRVARELEAAAERKEAER